MSEKKKQEIPIPFKLDDFFTTQNDREENLKEHIEQIDISLIDDFKDHPFSIINNGELRTLKESIKERGIDTPTIVRKKDNGRYEMISGHRRMFASSLLGLKTIPCVVKDLSDDEATIIMVDSNLQQRKQILPSEKAFAYKMKYDALKRQGKRTDLTSGPMDQKLTAEKIGTEVKESEKTIRRFIRLTYLIQELLDMVDNSELNLSPTMGIRPAVEISYLKEEEQKMLVSYINMNLSTPSLTQAQEIKDLSKKGILNQESLNQIMKVEKPNQVPKFSIQEKKLFDVLPKNIKRDQVEDFVLKACSYYAKHLKQKQMER